MDKNRWLYLTNTLLFVAFSTLAVLGFLLKFAIPHGGRLGGAPPTFLGLTRHDWADFHGTVAIFFICLAVIHLVLNWKWVVQSSKRYLGNHWQKGLWALAGSWVVVLFLGYLVSRF
ncbi:protein of unknown function [Desulfacinum hydrothermale DSM 13146]|uniref:Flavinylation-associated cytochrome domain-containing protein n=1 Tax=Desulfacinum hydrothermale DSM 13146 TaxID=1121390 RepID=A0A1W1XP50_9BACT|nr:DUF4405 domain-containing protein [Desulfacinum hydrothermale]SMC25632.1 protein of unknown function [Desulfacinum hydrothermale DSM 13146]